MSVEYSTNSYDQIAKKLTTLDKRINALYEDKADGKISFEFWEEKVVRGDAMMLLKPFNSMRGRLKLA